MRLPVTALRRRWRRLLLVGAAGSALLCGCGGGLLLALTGPVSIAGVPAPQGDPARCGPVTADGSGALASLDREQLARAALIVRVGAASGVPPRGRVIAVATAMQESGLRNLPHLGPDNDHDSLGLFQQRPSQGWGDPEQLRDPEYAARAFYRRLLQVDGWQQLPLTQAAQAVQRSAHPDAYARHEPLAVAVVGMVTAHDGDRARCFGPGEVSAAGWTRPVPGTAGSGFRNRDCGGAGLPRCHHGVDIALPHGTPVRAAAAGVVSAVRCDASRNGRPHSCDVDSPLDAAGVPLLRGCGWYVEIRHRAGAVTRYCHLRTEPQVDVGQPVAAGERIGEVGSSGRSSGPHLHFEVHPQGDRTNQGAVDPEAFLAARGVTLD